jgi:O-antigen/teichoic acid export membrane protein
MLKAINQTRYFLYGDVLAIVLNLALLTVLMPLMGLVGAVTAYVISSYAEGLYLGWWVTRLYGLPVSQFVPWRQLSRVALSSAIALAVTYLPFWSSRLAFLNMIVGSILYFVAYAALLMLLRIEEARQLADRAMQRVIAMAPFIKFRLT